MALIRGLNGKAPCPICLIRQDNLWNLQDTSLLRTTENSQAVILKARSQQLLSHKEEILKEAGLRDIDVSIKFDLIESIIILYYRMSFGLFLVVIHIGLFLLIVYMFFMVDYLVDIYGLN